MPSKNALKIYVKDSYYHVYNRGLNKATLFHDKQDYLCFLGLFKRHLMPEPQTDRFGREFRSLNDQVELLCYCLMTNHFHLLIYNLDENGIEALMRSVATSYSMYYNRKYSRIGPIFQGVYKAVLVGTDGYLQHITRYIHRNPEDYSNYDYSSYKNYLGKRNQKWLNPDRILELFDSTEEYIQFVRDYEKLDNEEVNEINSGFADK
jgi:putative transposase